MSSLSNTPRWRNNVSRAPRAKLTIKMDAERDGAIPLLELANIAKHVQDAVDRIARSLHDRSAAGRSPKLLKQLSALEAVGIETGSAVLEIEAPHNTEQFPIGFSEVDTGVRAIELFVETVDSLSHRADTPAEVSDVALSSVLKFSEAMRRHEHVRISFVSRDMETSVSFVPRLLGIDSNAVPKEPASLVSVNIIGRLYEVNLDNNMYRVKDELGRVHYVSLATTLDTQSIARSLLGETVRITATPAEGGPDGHDRLDASAIVRVGPPHTDDYYSWDVATALDRVDPIESIGDLALPGIDKDEADAFWHAVND